MKHPAAPIVLVLLVCSACDSGNLTPVEHLSLEAQRAGDAHLALVDEMVVTARAHARDCDAMADALDDLMAARASTWKLRSHADVLSRHYGERVLKRLRRLAPFVSACANSKPLREVFTALQKGADR